MRQERTNCKRQENDQSSWDHDGRKNQEQIFLHAMSFVVPGDPGLESQVESLAVGIGAP